MDRRIPPELHPLLKEYANLINQDVPGKVSAFYLEGSIALDGFNSRLSDVDFIAILNDPAGPGEVEKLREIHRQIARQYPRWQLSGRYLQPVDMGRSDREAYAHLNYHDGKLEWANRFGLGSVTGWIVKNRGICVFGPPPQELPYNIDMDDLLRTQHENLNRYWLSWTTRPVRILTLLSDWGIQWTVLGVLRQFYTLRERKIVSKVTAGEYALTCLPERWHSIIQEAIHLRDTPKKTAYRSRIKRAVEAFVFLKYVILAGNEQFRIIQKPNSENLKDTH